MCAIFLMALYGVALGWVVGHTILWLIPRLVRVFPILLGGFMIVSVLYAIGHMALHP